MEGEGPYREPRPLNEVIPPDRRRQRTIVLVLASMIAGGIIFQLVRSMIDSPAEPPLLSPAIVPYEPPPTLPPTSTSIVNAKPGPLTQEEIEQVVAAHRTSLKQACWQSRTGPDAPTSAAITLSIIVGANGDVVSSAASGNDAIVAGCVEAHARSWMFPAHGGRSATVQIPINFLRE